MARRLTVLVYRMLRYGQDYIDIGEACYEARFRQPGSATPPLRPRRGDQMRNCCSTNRVRRLNCEVVSDKPDRGIGTEESGRCGFAWR